MTLVLRMMDILGPAEVGATGTTQDEFNRALNVILVRTNHLLDVLRDLREIPRSLWTQDDHDLEAAAQRERMILHECMMAISDLCDRGLISSEAAMEAAVLLRSCKTVTAVEGVLS